MSQATPLIGPNKSGLTYRQEDNDGKQALLNHHKGPAAPSYAEAGMIWLDDAATPWLLKVYDGSNWITLSAINATEDTVLPYAGVLPMRGLALSADTGAVNAYAASPVPAVSTYVDGLIAMVKVASANTGSCTLALNGLSAVAVEMPDGSTPPLGALRTDGIYIFCYEGGVFKVLNPSPTQASGVLQAVSATYTATTAIATLIPADNTIPTSTEGVEILSVTITPQTTASKMLIRVTGFGGVTAAATVTAALFANSDTAAFFAAGTYIATTVQPSQISVSCDHAPGSLAPITYKLRVGPSAGQFRPNGTSTVGLFGGAARWVMTVEEYAG